MAHFLDHKSVSKINYIVLFLPIGIGQNRASIQKCVALPVDLMLRGPECRVSFRQWRHPYVLIMCLFRSWGWGRAERRRLVS